MSSARDVLAERNYTRIGRVRKQRTKTVLTTNISFSFTPTKITRRRQSIEMKESLAKNIQLFSVRVIR